MFCKEEFSCYKPEFPSLHRNKYMELLAYLTQSAVIPVLHNYGIKI